jgi:preprotein translocase subunit SecA
MEDELILQYAPDEARAQLPDSKAHWALGHAQRVAEGVNLEIHRNTWRYNKLIEEQRRIVLEHRDRVLRSDDALSALARQCPERLAQLSSSVNRGVLVSAARQIVLFHLDRGWAEHLAFLAELREGIHLRALGHGIAPLDEFHRESVRAFGALLDTATAQSAETFRIAEITADGVDLEAIGLKRPTATWTYLVHENPFGTDIDRAIRSIGRRIRKLAVLWPPGFPQRETSCWCALPAAQTWPPSGSRPHRQRLRGLPPPRPRGQRPHGRRRRDHCAAPVPGRRFSPRSGWPRSSSVASNFQINFG